MMRDKDILKNWRKLLNEKELIDGEAGEPDWEIKRACVSELDIQLCELVSMGAINELFIANLVDSIKAIEQEN